MDWMQKEGKIGSEYLIATWRMNGHYFMDVLAEHN